MPVEAACPSCEGKFRLPDAAAGKKIRCPKCKGPLDVPPLGAEPAAVAEPQPAAVAPAPSAAVAPAEPIKPAAPLKPPTPAAAAPAPAAVTKPTAAPAAPVTKETAAKGPVFKPAPAEGLKSTWRTASQEPAPFEQPRAEAPKPTPAPASKPTPAKPTAPVFVPPSPAEMSPSAAKPKPPEPAKPAAPAVAPELWFLKGEDGETYGPVDRPTLNGWHDEGRMTADSQLLKHGTEQWQWASDLYPDLEEPEPEETAEPPPPAASTQQVADDEDDKPLSRKAKSSRVARKQEEDEADEEDQELSPHSKPVAVLLGFTLGWLGIHRFYLGYVGIGLAMLFTLGGLLIWSITDSLRILFGHVTDSEGKKLRD